MEKSANQSDITQQEPVGNNIAVGTKIISEQSIQWHSGNRPTGNRLNRNSWINLFLLPALLSLAVGGTKVSLVLLRGVLYSSPL